MSADALKAAHEKSVALYLERQRVEMDRQRLGIRAQQIDHELVLLDGEIRALSALIPAAAPVEVPHG